MADLQDIREAIKATLGKVIPDLAVYPYEPDSPLSPPCLELLPTGPLAYANRAIGSENVRFDLAAVLTVHTASSEEGWAELDAYRSISGVKSIRGAIVNDPTLGGVVTHAEVTGSSEGTRAGEEGQIWEFSSRFVINIMWNQ